MAQNLPTKLTHAQAQTLQSKLEEIVKSAQVDWDADETTVRMELGFVCARFAVNAGVLDRDRLPVEERDDRKNG